MKSFLVVSFFKFVYWLDQLLNSDTWNFVLLKQIGLKTTILVVMISVHLATSSLTSFRKSKEHLIRNPSVIVLVEDA